MSSLQQGRETNAGRVFKLTRESGRTTNLTVYHEAGLQWTDWPSTLDVLTGRGLNRQIERAYGTPASGVPGAGIVLVGYSRGEYDVWPLARVICCGGLLRDREATFRNIRLKYRHYRAGGQSETAPVCRGRFCHEDVCIEAICVWNTVKAFGLRLPLLWGRSELNHNSYNHSLGPYMKNGFHAVTLDETRALFSPAAS